MFLESNNDFYLQYSIVFLYLSICRSVLFGIATEKLTMLTLKVVFKIYSTKILLGGPTCIFYRFYSIL